ncbi:2156_t:CDS:2 [Dentiscutata erythropus]|uniref:2156_t:CDS:1 n=1 Tax=Dentiscutata erythropus TaxID=1348616 RepID=A0A9N9B540_9GLOM|nr:2156_t:CDS:2 [Dentiscutata erythropus]
MESLNKPLDLSDQRERNFNLDRAEFLLFLSSLLYCRDDNMVHNAHETLTKLNSKKKKPTDRDLRTILKLLHDSENSIRAQIEQFDLNFTSISELNHLGGCYAGMFWSEKDNFIVVAFQGTTTTSFAQMLTDMTFQRMDAKPYLFGKVHEGYYKSLFETNNLNHCAALRMADTIRIKVAELNQKNNNPVNLWITGHSIGAAFATLFYTWLMKTPTMLNENCILRDAFTFASPPCVDNEFATEFSSLIDNPENNGKSLWRIITDDDLIPKMPPTFDNQNIKRFTKRVEVLNNSHIGNEVRFFHDGRKPISKQHHLFGNNKLLLGQGLKFNELKNLLENGDSSNLQKLITRPLRKLDLIEKSIPNCFLNHKSYRYFEVLEKSRRYFELDNQ